MNEDLCNEFLLACEVAGQAWDELIDIRDRAGADPYLVILAVLMMAIEAVNVKNPNKMKWFVCTVASILENDEMGGGVVAKKCITALEEYMK